MTDAQRRLIATLELAGVREFLLAKSVSQLGGLTRYATNPASAVDEVVAKFEFPNWMTVAVAWSGDDQEIFPLIEPDLLALILEDRDNRKGYIDAWEAHYYAPLDHGKASMHEVLWSLRRIRA